MNPHLNTVFRWCNDIDQMRRFYSDCLQLDETYYRNDEEHGWLTYQLGQTQLVFTRSAAPLPLPQLFAKNPAYQGGETTETSWVIELELEAFDDTVVRLQEEPTPFHGDGLFSNRPNHLQLIVRDPMGMTIELYAHLKEQEDDGTS